MYYKKYLKYKNKYLNQKQILSGGDNYIIQNDLGGDFALLENNEITVFVHYTPGSRDDNVMFVEKPKKMSIKSISRSHMYSLILMENGSVRNQDNENEVFYDAGSISLRDLMASKNLKLVKKDVTIKQIYNYSELQIAIDNNDNIYVRITDIESFTLEETAMQKTYKDKFIKISVSVPVRINDDPMEIKNILHVCSCLYMTIIQYRMDDNIKYFLLKHKIYTTDSHVTDIYNKVEQLIQTPEDISYVLPYGRGFLFVKNGIYGVSLRIISCVKDTKNASPFSFNNKFKVWDETFDHENVKQIVTYGDYGQCEIALLSQDSKTLEILNPSANYMNKHHFSAPVKNIFPLNEYVHVLFEDERITIVSSKIKSPKTYNGNNIKKLNNFLINKKCKFITDLVDIQ